MDEETAKKIEADLDRLAAALERLSRVVDDTDKSLCIKGWIDCADEKF